MQVIINRLQDLSNGEVYLVSTDDKLVDCNLITASEYGETRTIYRDYYYPIILIPNCGYGDYLGGSTQRSNSRVMLDKYGNLPGITRIIGVHGAYEIALNPLILRESNKELLEKLIEDLAYLSSDDGCLDDDDLSAFESEQESEDWENYGKSDFLREISNQLGSDFSDLLETSDDSCLASIYGDVCEDNNSYPYYEVSSTYFPIPDSLDVETILGSEWMKLEKTSYKYLVNEEGENFGEKTIYLITEVGFDNAELVAAQLGYGMDSLYTLQSGVPSLVSNIVPYFALYRDGELVATFSNKVNPDQLELPL